MFYTYLEFQMMDKVHKPSNSVLFLAGTLYILQETTCFMNLSVQYYINQSKI
jgi:hypothetical protein